MRAAKTAGSRAFLLFLLLLTTLCAALTAGGLLRVYQLARAYEQSTPGQVVTPLVDLFLQERYDELTRLSNLSLTPFERPEDIGRALRLRGGNPAEAKAVRRAPEHYLICGDKGTFADVRLRRRGGEGSFGLDVWELERLILAVEPHALTVLAPEQAKVRVNGLLLSDDWAQQAAADAEYGALPESVAQPMMARYHIEGLFAPEEVTGQNGPIPCEIIRRQTVVSVRMPASPSLVETLSPIAEQASQAYARFITRDAERDEVLPFFLPQTAFYTHLQQFDNRWYNEHDDYSFANMASQNWQMNDERHVRCDISFDYAIRMGRRTFDYPSRYTLFFVRTDAGWKISNLVVR